MERLEVCVPSSLTIGHVEGTLLEAGEEGSTSTCCFSRWCTWCKIYRQSWRHDPAVVVLVSRTKTLRGVAERGPFVGICHEKASLAAFGSCMMTSLRSWEEFQLASIRQSMARDSRYSLVSMRMPLHLLRSSSLEVLPGVSGWRKCRLLSLAAENAT